MLVLTDLERRLVLDVLEDRSKTRLVAWLRQPPAGIDLSELTTVATDLWSHYRDAVVSVFGDKITVVADRFHVVQNLHEAIHKIRRQTQKAAQDEAEKAALKGLRYLLLKNEANLTASDRLRLDQLAATQPTLYALWQLRQQLHDWYETDQTIDQARILLQRWIEQARSLALTPLDTFCQTLSNWEAEIIGFFQHRVTSGFVEGTNSKIRLLKSIAFGMPNFEHFRLRIIWACG